MPMKHSTMPPAVMIPNSTIPTKSVNTMAPNAMAVVTAPARLPCPVCCKVWRMAR